MDVEVHRSLEGGLGFGFPVSKRYLVCHLGPLYSTLFDRSTLLLHTVRQKTNSSAPYT